MTARKALVLLVAAVGWAIMCVALVMLRVSADSLPFWIILISYNIPTSVALAAGKW